MPGYRLYEYKLVISPHEELAGRISDQREEFARNYKTRFPRGRRSPITLVQFTQYEMMEEKIRNRLRTIAMGYHPFRVELRDFGSFPSHTIFIHVNSKLPIRQLVGELRSEGQRLLKADDTHKPQFFPDPYICIATRLQPWQYEKAWLEYSQRHFSGRFLADRMILLKRPEGELKYQVLDRMDFQNLPVSVRQGELF